jgi:hypothetical protein
MACMQILQEQKSALFSNAGSHLSEATTLSSGTPTSGIKATGGNGRNHTFDQGIRP